MQLKRRDILLSLLVLATAFAMLMSGCSGSGTSMTSAGPSGPGALWTISGTVDSDGDGLSAMSADNLTGTITAIDAAAVTATAGSGVIGTGTISANGAFSINITVPDVKFTLVLRANLTASGKTLTAVYPIDLSNPPAGAGNNVITLLVSNSTTALVSKVSDALGMGANLIGSSPLPTGTTFQNIADAVVNRGGQYIAYTNAGLRFVGNVDTAMAAITPQKQYEACAVCHAPSKSEDPAVAASTTKLRHTFDPSRDNTSWVISNISVGFTDNSSDNVSMRDRFFVRFKVTTNGTQIVDNITTGVSANLSKLVVPTNGAPSFWVNYIGTATNAPVALPGRPSTTGVLLTNEAATGFYTVVFANTATGTNVDNTNVKAHRFADNASFGVFNGVNKFAWNPNATHRVGIQISRDSANVTARKATNAVYDFVPAGGAVTQTRNITSTARCNDCHIKLNMAFSFHGGNRYLAEFCVTCHTPDRAAARTELVPDSNGNFDVTSTAQYIYSAPYGNSPLIDVVGASTLKAVVGDSYNTFGDMPVFMHKLHMGNRLGKQGYNYAGIQFNHIGYPQDVTNCRKCHDENTGSNGNNWKTNPSMKACGSCHDKTSFVEPVPAGMTLHKAGYVLPDPNSCAGCHTPENIEAKHRTNNATTYNPNVLTGLSNFKYEIDNVTVNANNNPVVKFRIRKDGVPITNFNTTGTTLLTGFTGAPSFLIAYSKAQDGINAPADFNNLGRPAGQPISVSLTPALISAGTLDNATGFYTVTLTSVTFPAGSNMRTVALQGYFSQTISGTSYPRYTIAAVKTIATDTKRRSVVDPAKCSNCHEWFTAHGGNRVIGKETLNNNDTPLVCVLCHNPNLSTSGRGADPALIAFQASSVVGTANPTGYTGTLSQAAKDAAVALVAALGNDPLTYPEDSNNFKDLIHGIHAAEMRNGTVGNKFVFVRDRSTSGVYYYDWSHVTFPTSLKYCLACHMPNTFAVSNIPANALSSTQVTTNGALTRSGVATSRANVPNSTDQVIQPVGAACFSCHASNAAKGHGQTQGAGFTQRRGVTGIE